jgi:hypothetical protein
MKMIPPNNISGFHLVHGMTGRSYWYSIARKTDYLFLACLSTLFSQAELAQLRSVDDEIDRLDRSLMSGGTQKQRVLRAIEYGHVNSHSIAAMTNLSLEITSAWLSVLCNEGKIEKWGEKNLNRGGVARATHFYRLIPAVCRKPMS